MRRRSLSPRSPPRRLVDAPGVEDIDPACKAKRESQLAAHFTAVELKKMEGKKGGEAKEKGKGFGTMAEFAQLMSSRSGGVYMPPVWLCALQVTAAQDRNSAED